MRSSAFIFSALLTSSVALSVHTAFAQAPAVSDNDRATARELYRQGTALQQEGKFAAALEKFQLAQRIFSAPTHLLYIAECQAALGKLVEATETYRSLVRMELPPDSSPAFLAAKQQAEAELPQVEPRVPTLRVDVKPANAPELAVTIDGEPLNLAFIGVNRMINPGKHKIGVKAKGYSDVEYSVTVRERETATVPMRLQPRANESIAVAPEEAVPPAPPPPPYSAGATPPPDSAPPRYVVADTGARSSTPPSFSFMFGPQVGLLIPATGTTKTGQALTSISGVGTGFGADVGIRFARYFYLGTGVEFGFFTTPSAISQYAPNSSTQAHFESRSRMLYGSFGVISHSHGVGFFGELGGGYRWYGYDISLDPTSDATFSQSVKASVLNGGPEFQVSAGLHIKAGKYFRLVPKLQLGVGSFTSQTVDCGTLNCTVGTPNVSAAAENTNGNSQSAYTFVRLGLGGYFNFDN